MTFDLIILTVAAVTFFIGGLSKGAMGFGLPIIAIPMLTIFGSLPLALSIAVPPVVATNLWQMWTFRRHRKVAFLPWFLIPGALGLISGAALLKNIDGNYLKILLGCLVLFYLFGRRSNKTVAASKSTYKLIAPITGALAGIVHGATGLSSLVGTPYFLAASLERGAFIFCNSAMFTIFSMLHMPALAAVGLYQTSAFVSGFIIMPAAFAGLWLGERIAEKLKATTFPLLIKIMLTLAAILTIWSGLSQLLALR